MSAHIPSSPLVLGLFGADIAEDPPVAEPECISHGVTDVGPAEDGQGDSKDGVEDSHHFGNGSLRGNMTVSWKIENL